MTSLEKHNQKLKEEARIRRIEYNKNPHTCKFCSEPILIKENEQYKDVFRKKFCSRSCASKYGHKETDKYRTTINKPSRIETDFTDEELIRFYKESNSLKDLETKIGYKNITSQNRVVKKFLELGLDINNLKNKEDINVVDLTKRELYNRRSSWQNARSTIQKYARITYKGSDKPKECIVCKYTKHYEVAHITAVSDFSDDTLISEINHIDNLIALCPNHHWEYDNTDFDIKDYL